MPMIDRGATAFEHHERCSDCTGCMCRYCHCCAADPDREIYRFAGGRFAGGSYEDLDDEDDDDRGVSFIGPRRELKPTFHTSDKAHLINNPSRRYAALEIEVAGVNRKHQGLIESAVRQWDGRIVEDGSLPDTGFEINTAPAAGDLLLDQLENISRALKQQEAYVNTQCGLHVHVDCRDFTYYDLRRLVFLYEKLEPALFRMVPHSRRDSQYCQPCGEEYANAIRTNAIPKESKKNLIAGVYKNRRYQDKQHDNESARYTVLDAKSSRYHGVRYHALNLHSWFYRGTIECRLAAGTTNYEKLANWALLWVAIVDSAYRMSEPQIRKLTGGPLEILAGLAPSTEIHDWILARTQKFANIRTEEDS